MDEISKLEELCKPILDYLKGTNPYTTVLISSNFIKIIEETLSIPTKNVSD